MNVKDIVKKYLEENNFDGLVNRGKCSCKIRDLMPCYYDSIENCEAGNLKDCEKCDYASSQFDEIKQEDVFECNKDFDFCIE
jgi:hypothetical protein